MIRYSEGFKVKVVRELEATFLGGLVAVHAEAVERATAANLIRITRFTLPHPKWSSAR